MTAPLIPTHDDPPSAGVPVEARPSTVLPTVLVAIGIALGGLLLLAVFAYLALSFGIAGVVFATVVAFVPLALVLLAIRWIDRWEPEPRSALWFAFLWGAGVSVAVALVFDLGVQIASAATGVTLQNDLTASVVQAPIIEELAKGFGVLLVLGAGRRYFDGPVDGLVYAATVAAGFAFTENILYFGSTLVESGAGGLVPVFVLRGLFSPFAHVIFTSCTGLALGFASRRTGAFGALGWFLLGLIPAVALHALWNGALLVVSNVIGYYFLVQVPIFAAWVAIVVTLRVHERRLTRARLADYAGVGWFTPGEVDLVAGHDGRRRALAWARAQPHVPGLPDKPAAMRAFLRHATSLAHARQRALVGRAAIGATPDERALLEAIVADRRALLG
ncbi:protease PrsW [Herbiconiux sp. L3-i23]|nr:PrsW family intramembrane metalloprotease [Herbiconiux sp. L3-i23]BDI22133.1 protease PrsW [Herbiconiux sp. L3-i23]